MGAAWIGPVGGIEACDASTGDLSWAGADGADGAGDEAGMMAARVGCEVVALVAGDAARGVGGAALDGAASVAGAEKPS